MENIFIFILRSFTNYLLSDKIKNNCDCEQKNIEYYNIQY